MSAKKKDYKRAYYDLRDAVGRLKEARGADVQRIARANKNHGAPGYQEWSAYQASMPSRTGEQLRNLVRRAGDIHESLTEGSEQ